MTTLTIDIPDDLALRLTPMRERIGEILEAGLRETASRHHGYDAAVIDFLASGPSPAEIVALQASPDLEARVALLLDKNREGTLTEGEERELDRYEQLDYFVARVKAQARRRLS